MKHCYDNDVFFTSQVLFDFLAFKNDVNFWRKRKTIIGVSKRTGLEHNSITSCVSLEAILYTQ